MYVFRSKTRPGPKKSGGAALEPGGQFRVKFWDVFMQSGRGSVPRETKSTSSFTAKRYCPWGRLLIMVSPVMEKAMKLQDTQINFVDYLDSSTRH